MRRILVLVVLVLAVAPTLLWAGAAEQWPTERARAWYAQQPWPVGSNFIPSTAINELEMWQADTFDLPTIDRELGWAESLGIHCAPRNPGKSLTLIGVLDYKN